MSLTVKDVRGLQDTVRKAIELTSKAGASGADEKTKTTNELTQTILGAIKNNDSVNLAIFTDEALKGKLFDTVVLNLSTHVLENIGDLKAEEDLKAGKDAVPGRLTFFGLIKPGLNISQIEARKETEPKFVLSVVKENLKTSILSFLDNQSKEPVKETYPFEVHRFLPAIGFCGNPNHEH